VSSGKGEQLPRGRVAVSTGRFRRYGLLLASLSLLISQSSAARSKLEGRYRLSGGPDEAAELILKPGGTFEYFLAAGSLDEHAKGRWQDEHRHLQLTTIPKPVAPVFSTGAASRVADAPLVLHVTGPRGGGIAGVDLRVGFDRGEDIDAYTQDYGWSLPEQERRTPRWVEFGVPIYQLNSQRFLLDLTNGNELTFLLTPNDMGEIDFTGMQIDVEPSRIIIHRGEALMVFSRDDAKHGHEPPGNGP
jgi:hypothetical protein